MSDAIKDAPLTRAYIDPSIGWAMLSTATTTYVWNHAKRTSSASPTCYTFPHTKTSRRAVPPLTALVQHGHASAGSEPGVLFVYPATGKISCWDRVAMVLANTASKGAVKGRIEVGVELADEEVINGLTKLEVRLPLPLRNTHSSTPAARPLPHHHLHLPRLPPLPLPILGPTNAHPQTLRNHHP